MSHAHDMNKQMLAVAKEANETAKAFYYTAAGKLVERRNWYDLGEGVYDDPPTFHYLYDHFKQFRNMLIERGGTVVSFLEGFGDHVVYNLVSEPGTTPQVMTYWFFSEGSYRAYLAYEQRRARTGKIENLLDE
ncbi:hypothetical protein [Hymenobacter sp. B1770]|uniref:hypothetical protein n=1 Tax=Hymenobacter sp. B1770 TaxID=1718788 RepID=UPI003CF8CD6B